MPTEQGWGAVVEIQFIHLYLSVNISLKSNSQEFYHVTLVCIQILL
jgi:hypothetical protein